MHDNQHDPFDQGSAISSRNNFYAALKELTGFHCGVDKRSEDRMLRSVTVVIQPLDMDFQADGESFHTISRDISSNGMGFICKDPLLHEYIRIAMPEQTQATVIARVCYNLSVGNEYPLYLAGVQFVS